MNIKAKISLDGVLAFFGWMEKLQKLKAECGKENQTRLKAR